WNRLEAEMAGATDPWGSRRAASSGSTSALTSSRRRMVPLNHVVAGQRAYPSEVVVERELPGVGTEAHLVDLVGPLVGDPRVDEVVGEDAAGLEEVVVGLQAVEHRLQRAGHLRHLRELLGRQVVEVLVDRVRRL